MDPVSDFMAITQSDEATALQYLNATDFNLENAIAIFFAGGAGGAGGDERGQNNGVQQPPFRDGASDGSGPHQRTGRLVDDDDESMFYGAREAPERFMDIEQFVQRGRQQRSRVEEISSSDDDGSALDTLFRPPPYAYRGTLSRCCDDAIKNHRWVILNIQKKGDFRSKCLNRDLWNDKTVSDILPDMLILFQLDCGSTEGQMLMTNYGIRQTPYVAILNPLTKAVVYPLQLAKLIQKTGEYNVTSFLDELTSFVERNLDNFPTRIQSSEFLPPAEVPPTLRATQKAPAVRPRGHPESDDEELQMAIAMSKQLEEEEAAKRNNAKAHASTSPAPSRQTPSAVTQPVGVATTASTSTGSAAPVRQPAAPPSPPPTPTVHSVDISRFENPSDPSQAFKLRMKLPNGQVELSVAHDIPVSLLLAYVSCRVHQANTAQYPEPPPIELRGGFPPKALAPPADKAVTLKSWGVLRQNDSVLVHIL